MEGADSGTVTLVSKEGDQFTVDIEVAKMSELAKGLIDEKDDEDEIKIPLPNVKASVLRKVIDYCEHHREEPMAAIEKPLKSTDMSEVTSEWYADYADVEHGVLFELILAANYMDIKPLLELSSAAVAAMIKGKTPEELRRHFDIDGFFTPEEEEMVRRENKWCEEP